MIGHAKGRLAVAATARNVTLPPEAFKRSHALRTIVCHKLSDSTDAGSGRSSLPASPASAASSRSRSSPGSCASRLSEMSFGMCPSSGDEDEDRDEPDLEPAPAKAERPRPCPSDAQLGQLFDDLVAGSSGGALTQAGLLEAIVKLNQNFGLGLGSNDGPRLETFLLSHRAPADGPQLPGFVSRAQFIEGVQGLARVLCTIDGLSLRQIKIALFAAFDKFDVDGNGKISIDEFAAAAMSLGLKIENDDLAILYKFLSEGHAVYGAGAQDPRAESSQVVKDQLTKDVPIWDKLSKASEQFVEGVRAKAGLRGFGTLVEEVSGTFQRPGTVQEKMSRASTALSGSAEDIVKTMETFVDSAGLAVAFDYLKESLQELNGGLLPAEQDPSNLFSIAVLVTLTAANLQKHFDDFIVKDMSENEALLFATFFLDHGFTQSEFQRLLRCRGFRWSTAEPGEVLNDPNDRRLKLFVRGCAEVESASHQGHVKMPAGSSIGETMFTRGKSIWVRETVKALDPVTYAVWDFDELRECLSVDAELDLRMNALLSKTMSMNITTARTMRTKFQQFPGAAGQASGTSSEHFVQAAAPHSSRASSRRYWHRKKKDGTPTSYEGIFAKMNQGNDPAIGRPDVLRVYDYLDDRLAIGGGVDAQTRLVAYLGVDGCKRIGVDCFADKMHRLEQSLRGLDEAALSIPELASILHRSVNAFDASEDANITRDEFSKKLRRLDVDLDEGSVSLLFRYFDMEDTGNIDVKKWESIQDGGHQILCALENAFDSHLRQKGFRRVDYIAKNIRDSMVAPGHPAEKLKLVMSELWDGIDSIAAALGGVSDVLPILYCIWCEISDVSDWSDSNELQDLKLSPFLAFLAISAARIVHQLSDKHTSHLSEREATLFARSFEPTGFPITAFLRLLSHADATWDEYRDGEEMRLDRTGDSLYIIVKGRCGIADRDGTLRSQRSCPTRSNLLRTHVFRELVRLKDRSLLSAADGDAAEEVEALAVRRGPVIAGTVTDAAGGSIATSGASPPPGLICHETFVEDHEVCRAEGNVTLLHLRLGQLRARLLSDEKLMMNLNRSVTFAMADRLLEYHAPSESFAASETAVHE